MTGPKKQELIDWLNAPFFSNLKRPELLELI
jgi:hypothetical protein